MHIFTDLASDRRAIAVGAPQDEIEVTPAMIEAGADALRREFTLDCSRSQAEDLAADVIRRALAARSK
jgi:hypothetical protein